MAVGLGTVQNPTYSQMPDSLLKADMGIESLNFLRCQMPNLLDHRWSSTTATNPLHHG